MIKTGEKDEEYTLFFAILPTWWHVPHNYGNHHPNIHQQEFGFVQILGDLVLSCSAMKGKKYIKLSFAKSN